MKTVHTWRGFVRKLVLGLILSGGFLAMGHAAGLDAVKREVFPVPSVIAGIFRTGGLTAFDPFTVWERGSARPSDLWTVANPGAEASRLPEGRVYDVVPAWTARGFRPHAGTRVLYHPGSKLLFASIAAEDEREVRAYCQWPPGIWLGEENWRGSRSHQLQARITAWAVPAAGPGGWQFRPERPADLMALGAEARRVVGRQMFVVRGGQKGKSEAMTTPRRTMNTMGPGMVSEMECTFADDGEHVDFNFAISFLTRLKTGVLTEAKVAFQQLAKKGESWLVEAGSLPGEPPERLFFVFESHPVEQDGMEPSDLGKVIGQWTGRPQFTVADSAEMAGRMFGKYEIEELARQRQEAESPKPRAEEADPFALPASGRERSDPLPGLGGDSLPAVAVPELFGEAKLPEITPVLERFFGLEPGNIRAWVDGRDLWPSPYVFVQGKPASLSSMARQMAALEPYRSMNSAQSMTADTTLSLSAPGAAPDGETVIWRGRIPVRGGQTSSLQNLNRTNASAGVEPVMGGWDLKIEATLQEGTVDAAKIETGKPGPLEIKLTGSLRPPLVEVLLEWPALTEVGSQEGFSLRRVLGRTGDGREVILTVRISTGPKTIWSSDGGRLVGDEGFAPDNNLEWWWQQQAAGEVEEGK